MFCIALVTNDMNICEELDDVLTEHCIDQRQCVKDVTSRQRCIQTLERGESRYLPFNFYDYYKDIQNS